MDEDIEEVEDGYGDDTEEEGARRDPYAAADYAYLRDSAPPRQPGETAGIWVMALAPILLCALVVFCLRSCEDPTKIGAPNPSKAMNEGYSTMGKPYGNEEIGWGKKK